MERFQPRDDEPEDRAEKAVPYHRFAAKVALANELRAKLEELAGKMDEQAQAHADELKTVREAAAADVVKIRQSFAEDQALGDLGLKDKQGRIALRAHLEDLPEAERKVGAAAWLKAHLEAVEAHRADPKKAAPPEYPWLSGYLPAAKDAKTPPPTPPKVGRGDPPVEKIGATDISGIIDILMPKSE